LEVSHPLLRHRAPQRRHPHHHLHGTYRGRGGRDGMGSSYCQMLGRKGRQKHGMHITGQRLLCDSAWLPRLDQMECCSISSCHTLTYASPPTPSPSLAACLDFPHVVSRRALSCCRCRLRCRHEGYWQASSSHSSHRRNSRSRQPAPVQRQRTGVGFARQAWRRRR
jgi:hypothetical protein